MNNNAENTQTVVSVTNNRKQQSRASLVENNSICRSHPSCTCVSSAHIVSLRRGLPPLPLFNRTNLLLA